MFRRLSACGLAIRVLDRPIIQSGPDRAGRYSWTIPTTFAGQFATSAKTRSSAECPRRPGHSSPNTTVGHCTQGTIPTRHTQNKYGNTDTEKCQGASTRTELKGDIAPPNYPQIIRLRRCQLPSANHQLPAFNLVSCSPLTYLAQRPARRRCVNRQTAIELHLNDKTAQAATADLS